MADTDIQLVRGTMAAGGTITFGTSVRVNDDAATDNYTEGNRPQFIPAVTVRCGIFQQIKIPFTW